MRRSPDQIQPEFRQLRIYAIDPMVSRAGEHQATVQIRFEDLELRGGEAAAKADHVSFAGRRIEVVDVDAAGPTPVWFRPVDLDDAKIAMQHGLDPSESDPQFHQQMVYAVAMRTLEQFDRALGRVVYFRGRRRLRLVPHAFRGGNAFYHPKLRAVLFGYFQASKEAPGDNLPGQVIFTCLSHDIIAHEMTHAIVDRLRPFFNTAVNPHVRAFHEGFADIVALFQRLSFRDLVQRALQDPGESGLGHNPLLSDIAGQFGQGVGSGKALRTALNNTTRLQDVHEEHDLGAVLVAAVFDGFLTTFHRRTADLLRMAGGNTNKVSSSLHPDLSARLAGEYCRTAQSVLTMCIRAFDYLPPAGVTFGAFLRALVTADWELNPLDEVGLRAAIIEACRRRGIFALDAGSLAVDALLLDAARREEWKKHEATFQTWVDLAIQQDIDEQRSATPEDDAETEQAHMEIVYKFFDLGPPVRSESKEAEDDLPSGSQLRLAIKSWFAALTAEERGKLGFLTAQELETPYYHSNRRLTSDGTMRFGLVVQLVQMQTCNIAGTSRLFPAGATLVIDVSGRVRFVVASPPLELSRSQMEQMAQAQMVSPLGWPTNDPTADPFAVDYRGMHEVRI